EVPARTARRRVPGRAEGRLDARAADPCPGVGRAERPGAGARLPAERGEVPSTEYPVPSTQHPAPGTQYFSVYPVPGAQHFSAAFRRSVVALSAEHSRIAHHSVLRTQHAALNSAPPSGRLTDPGRPTAGRRGAGPRPGAAARGSDPQEALPARRLPLA